MQALALGAPRLPARLPLPGGARAQRAGAAAADRPGDRRAALPRPSPRALRSAPSRTRRTSSSRAKRSRRSARRKRTKNAPPNRRKKAKSPSAKNSNPKRGDVAGRLRTRRSGKTTKPPTRSAKPRWRRSPPGFGLGGSLGFVVALFYTCLWAMRTGLLTRFWGSLGMALGIAFLLGPRPRSPLIWFVYFGLLLPRPRPRRQTAGLGGGRSRPLADAGRESRRRTRSPSRGLAERRGPIDGARRRRAPRSASSATSATQRASPAG